MVSRPTGAFVDAHEPCPLTSIGVVQRIVAPLVKETVPVGVPTSESTLAEKVTERPRIVEVGVTEAVTEVGSIVIVTGRVTVAIWPFASVTSNVTSCVPKPVGIPVISPVAGLRVSPFGKVPDTTDQL